MKKITGKDLLRIGFEESIILGTVLNFCENYQGDLNKGEVLSGLKRLIQTPELTPEDSPFYELSQEIIRLQKELEKDLIPLDESPKEFSIFGVEHIEEGALKQMHITVTDCRLAVFWRPKMQLFLMEWGWISVAEWHFRFMI